MKKNKELPEWDDGRTIADMNAEGMPWYRPDRASEGKAPGKQDSRTDTGRKLSIAAGFSKDESRAYTWGAIKAGLLVALVMCAGLVLFVLFCQHVWFH
jgi:hypothetical protein